MRKAGVQAQLQIAPICFFNALTTSIEGGLPWEREGREERWGAGHVGPQSEPEIEGDKER